MTELAKRIGCERTRLSKIEAGSIRPTEQFVSKYGKALGLTEQDESRLQHLTKVALFDAQRAEMNGLDAALKFHQLYEGLEQVCSTIEVYTPTGLPDVFIDWDKGLQKLFQSPIAKRRYLTTEQLNESLRSRRSRLARKATSFMVPVSLWAEAVGYSHVFQVYAFQDEFLMRSIELPPGFTVFDSSIVAIPHFFGGSFCFDQDSVNAYSTLFRSFRDGAKRVERYKPSETPTRRTDITLPTSEDITRNRFRTGKEVPGDVFDNLSTSRGSVTPADEPEDAS